MGVRGKGTAFESPCPAQHCRDRRQWRDAARWRDDLAQLSIRELDGTGQACVG